MVQPLPVLAGPQGSSGEPVHAGEQPLVSYWWFHAAGLRDHAPGPVHTLRQWSLVSVGMSLNNTVRFIMLKLHKGKDVKQRYFQTRFQL